MNRRERALAHRASGTAATTACLAIALLMVLCTHALAQDWAVKSADARIRLSVEGDLYERGTPQFSVDIDFNALLGYERTLAADSLALIDADSRERLGITLAQEAGLRHASGNPVLRVRWTGELLARFERRSWDLYFATVQPGAAGAWQPLERQYTVGEPGVLWETSFEQADPERDDRPVGMCPGGWDKEGETSERVWTDEEAHSGECSLKIGRVYQGEPPTNTNRPHWRTYPPRLFVRPGQSVRVSAWMKAPELAERSLPLASLYFQEEAGKRLTEGRLLLRGPRVSSDEWTRVMGVVPAPSEAASVTVFFGLHGQGVAYYDDLRVTVAPGAELPQLDVQVEPVLNRADVTAEEARRSDGKVLRCGVAGEPPSIDGALDGACWESAGSIDDFIPYLHVPGTEVTTIVRACADQEALYFGFECTEPDTSELVAKTEERDGPAWQDDSVEFFLDTNRDRRTFYQVIVNPKGVFFDQDAGAKDLAGPEWDGPITVATQIHADRWVAEIKLSFTGLRLAEAEGQIWGANFARTSLREGRSAYTWARVETGFLEPENFGRLALPFDPTTNSVTGRPLAGDEVYWGAGTLGFEIANRRDELVDVRVIITREADGTTAEATTSVEPNAETSLDLPMRFTDVGKTRVRYDLLERPGGAVLYATTMSHTVPEPLELSPDHLMSYVDERKITGSWTLGLSPEALGEARLELALSGEDGEAVASQTIAPSDTFGTFALDVGDLGAETWTLNVRLMQGHGTVSERSVVIDRIAGPF